MALDHFVYWRDAVPTEAAIVESVRAYLGGAGVVEQGRREGGNGNIVPGWWWVTLPGATPIAERQDPDDDGSRVVEVWIHDKPAGEECVDVLTRLADPFTRAVAEGLARYLRRVHRGRFDYDPVSKPAGKVPT